MKLKTLLQKYDALKEEEREAVRLEDAKKAYADLRKELLRAGYSNDEITEFLYALVRLASSADREADKEEYQLFVNATGATMPEEEFLELIKHGHDEAYVSSIDQVVDSLRSEAKRAALAFVACLLVSDRDLSPAEEELFAKLAKSRE